jgi:hypothetical protein
VTAEEFRAAALAMPEATEGEHMGHPDFRVGGKIFATLGVPDEEWAALRLPVDLQATLLESEPGAYKPSAGAWGRSGWTHVRLSAAEDGALCEAIEDAWRERAPKRLAAAYEARG